MTHRHCPRCKSDWYSASSKHWRCETCGMMLTEQDERPLELSKEKE